MATGTGVDRRSDAPTDALTRAGERADRGGRDRSSDALRTTPALIIISGAVLAVALLAMAVVAVQSRAPATTLGRQAADLAVNTSTSARQIYRTLADADVAASAVFLFPAGEAGQVTLIAEYDDKIQQVERALSESMGYAVDDSDRLTRLATIAARLQVYRGVVADALAAAQPRDGVDNQGVLASAYARVASHYMSTQLLRAAQDLWDYDTRRLREARVDARWWLGASVLIPLLALAALVVVQLWLRRRTRRRLNAGLLFASLATVAVLVMLLASWWRWPAADSRFPDLERQLDAQSATQQQLGNLLAGRADVYLGLGASVDPEGHREDFLNRDLCVDDAEDAAAGARFDCTTLDVVWSARQSNEPNAFRTAVNTVLAEGAAGLSFDAVTDKLTTDLENRDGEVAKTVDELPEAPRQLGGLAAWVTLLAGAGVVAGLRQRLVEYR